LFRRTIKYGISILVLAFLLGMAMINYSATIAILIGAITSWLLIRLLSLSDRIRSRILETGLTLIVIVLCVPLFLLLMSRFVPGGPFTRERALLPNEITPPPLLFKNYYLGIDCSDWKAGIFSIRETININPEWVDYYRETDIPMSIELPERELISKTSGFLAKEVKIIPAQAKPSGQATIELADGRTLEGNICTYSCDHVYVELHDIPAGSFLAAKDSENIQTHPYFNSETISWSVINLKQGIIFAFVPAPFYRFRSIIKPFIGASTWNQWLLSILGWLITMITSPIVRPALMSRLQKRFGPCLDKLPILKTSKDSDKKATIIISSTGDEKDVVVSEKKRNL